MYVSPQVETQQDGQECRLGAGEERPFSGVTCCMDFCAHSHYNRHNMYNGGATVVSLFANLHTIVSSYTLVQFSLLFSLDLLRVAYLLQCTCTHYYYRCVQY